MSRRSDRKWAEKDAREDAKGSKHGPKPDKVQRRRLTEVDTAKRATSEAKHASVFANYASGNDAIRRYMPDKAPPKSTTFQFDPPPEPDRELSHKAIRLAHKEAGEAHLKAADQHENAAAAAKDPEDESYHSEKADWHRQQAGEHAAAAGSEWDESKHPRDENGEFQ